MSRASVSRSFMPSIIRADNQSALPKIFAPTNQAMKLIACTCERHANAILEILNDAILNSTALYDYRERTPEYMSAWFQAKHDANFPVIGMENEAGQLCGFATYGSFRGWPAYKYTVEHSVYVHKDFRGQGLGISLMTSLIEFARSQDFHVLIGCIDMNNPASIGLHEKLGFTHAGTIREAGFKFGAWLDMGMYQLILDTPASPVDG